MAKRKRTFEPIPLADIVHRLGRLQVPHWCGEAWRLYDLAGGTDSSLPVIELGCWAGYSAAVMAAAGRAVVTIDPHDPELYNPTQLAIADGRDMAQVARDAWEVLGIADRITLIGATGADAAKQAPSKTSLLYLDANHHEADVRADLELYAGRVVAQGCCALHDWGDRGDEAIPWGVREAWRDYALTYDGCWSDYVSVYGHLADIVRLD